MRQCGIGSGEGCGPREVAFLQESTPSHDSLLAQPKEGLGDARTSSPITEMQGGHPGGCRAGWSRASRGACRVEKSSKGQGSLTAVSEPTGR